MHVLTVAGGIVRLGGDAANKLSAQVDGPVFELNLLGDRHAVLGDAGRAVALIEDHVAALRFKEGRGKEGHRVKLSTTKTRRNSLGTQTIGPRSGKGAPEWHAPG